MGLGFTLAVIEANDVLPHKQDCWLQYQLWVEELGMQSSLDPKFGYKTYNIIIIIIIIILLFYYLFIFFTFFFLGTQ
jgi:hypothetical protein